MTSVRAVAVVAFCTFCLRLIMYYKHGSAISISTGGHRQSPLLKLLFVKFVTHNNIILIIVQPQMLRKQVSTNTQPHENIIKMPPMSITTSNWDDSMGCSSSDSCNMKGEPISVKSVSFSTSIDIREVPLLQDVPAEERAATWYSQEDFHEIKQTLVATLRLMMAKKPVGSEYSTRGLEFKTPAGVKMRKKNKISALTAVWNEQVAQWKEDRTDEEAISFVYQRQNSKCREAARKFGLHDEKAARSYYAEDEASDSDLSFNNDAIEVQKQDLHVDSTKLDTQLNKSTCGPAAA